MKTLIVVDMQVDFCSPQGSLYVKDAEKLVSPISSLLRSGEYELVIFSQDWHPYNHISFADTWGKQPFTQIHVPGQVIDLWPTHCVQGSDGAKFISGLDSTSASLIVRKGMNENREEYSVFTTVPSEIDSYQGNPLAAYITEVEVKQIDFVGVAFDYCVLNSALALETWSIKSKRVLKQYTKSVFPEKDEETIEKLERAGIEVVQ